MLKILALLLPLVCLSNLAQGITDEIKIIRVVNSHPITNLDLEVEKRSLKYCVDVFQMNAFLEKLSCKLENKNCTLENKKFADFVLAAISEDNILDHRLNVFLQDAPGRTEVLQIIEKAAKEKNISKEQVYISLKKANITPDQMVSFFTNTIKRSRAIHHVCQSESTGFTRDEILRLATMSACFADLKLEYLSFSQPANKKGLEALKKIRLDLEKGSLPKGNPMKNIFLTEIQEKELGENLIFLEERTTSKIWRSGSNWNMLYLHKGTMINPELSPIGSYAQMVMSFKMQGNLRKIFDQLEDCSFVRDIK